ncbi:MAG: CcmD family protein [Vicinamibacterales bacterium]
MRTVVRSSRVWVAALLIVIASAGSRPVFAQQPPPNKPTAAQDQFVPVDHPMNQQDTLPAPRMLAAAYAFVWVALALYLWSIRRRLTSVEKEIADVNRRVTAGGRSA